MLKFCENFQFMIFKKFIISLLILLIILINFLPVSAETAENWCKKGEDLCNQGKYEEASRCFDKAIEFEPTNEYYKLKKEEALKALNKNSNDNSTNQNIFTWLNEKLHDCLQWVSERIFDESYEPYAVFPSEIFDYRSTCSTIIKVKDFENKWLFNAFGKSPVVQDWKSISADNRWFIVKIFYTNEKMYKDDYIQVYSKRKASIVQGSRFISYSWLTYNIYGNPNGLFAMDFDGVSNILYNVSYIMSIPSKFIHFSSECFKRGTGIYNGNRKIYGIQQSVDMFLWMIKELVIGLISSIIMLFLGTIIGIICHPLETLVNLTCSPVYYFDTNLLGSFIDFCISIIYPLWTIIFWV